ncbi:MAG: four helix bundle protein [Desulfobacterales bacterium]|nr:MAG: four helix bundle protein [Desulfobacterales bacterium]
MSEALRSDFRDLDVWKKCHDIRKMIWRLCKKFPAEEKFRLADQMIRASRSSTNNIAEGYGRFHFQENIQFCRQSRGSLFELIDHVLIAEECEYIDNKEREKLTIHITSAIRLLNGYVKYLRARRDEK